MVSEEELLSGLNPEQKEAVLTNSGSLLVFAGAGSGKTRVITTKIAYAISELGIPSYQILAVTFTNKACHEMQQRVEGFVGEDLAKRTMIKTFHSFGVWFLRKYASKAGLTSDFSIYDERQSQILLRQCFPEEEAADLLQKSKDIATQKEKGQKSSSKYYLAYQEKLRENNTVDFGDLINLPTEILANYPEVREEVHNRFRYILVDEYQDTNPAQLMLLKLLVGKEAFFCVVGDDDQSIYSFRNADVKTILNFPAHFEKTKQIVLSTNYRCNEKILASAKDIIEKNSTRAPKKLVSNISGGNKPCFCYFNENRDEAQFVAKKIKELCNGNYASCAVLFRTNNQAESFEDVFLFNNIPYRIVGDISFYNREEIQDALAALKLLINPADSVSFQRLAEKLVEGAGKVTIGKVLNSVSAFDTDLVRIAKEKADSGQIKGKAGESLLKFAQTFYEVRAKLNSLPNYELTVQLIEELGIDRYHRADEERIENLTRFVQKLQSDFYTDGAEGLFAFLETVSLEPTSDDDSVKENKVTLITMHRTKGLEFDNVFVTGLEDELFFNSKSLQTKADVEEERRLLYVSMTRAINNLYMSCCSRRFMYSHMNFETPLRFIKDLTHAHVDIEDKRVFRKTDSDFSYRKKSYGDYDNNRNSDYTSYNNHNGYYRSSYSAKSDDYESWQPKTAVKVIKKQKSVTTEVKKAVDLKVNDRVRSPLLGDGTITSIKPFGGREVIVVNFDSGRMGTFAKDKASEQFEKI